LGRTELSENPFALNIIVSLEVLNHLKGKVFCWMIKVLFSIILIPTAMTIYLGPLGGTQMDDLTSPTGTCYYCRCLSGDLAVVVWCQRKHTTIWRSNRCSIVGIAALLALVLMG
jgi:hypothetical protein